jgi:hypothetical protein
MTNANDPNNGSVTPSPEQVWDNLTDFSKEFVDQLRAQAINLYKQTVADIGKNVILSPQQSQNLQWGINTLLVNGVLATGADAQRIAELERNRLAAVAVVDNIEAVELKNLSDIVVRNIEKILSMGAMFLVQGGQALISAGFNALPGL